MSDETFDEAIRDVVYLVRCALIGDAPDFERAARMDLDAVYRASQRHQLVSACSTALEMAEIVDNRFVQARGKSVRKVALMDEERSEMFRRMDEVGIWHAPLKGCVLQGLWPSYGMRQMADNDVLIDPNRMEEARDIMLSMGFTCELFGTSAHDIYHKQPVCNFELHKSLFGPSHEAALYEYYRDSSWLLLPDGDGTCGMHMRDEDFYVYVMAHEYKHFSGGGTGLRSLADTYVYLKNKADSLDWAYVKEQLSALGLVDFEEQNRQVATALFSGESLTEEQEETFAYIAESGTYGTMAHSVENQLKRYGRVGYLLRRAALPLNDMASLYPILHRVPLLLPACWALRIGKALVRRPKVVTFQLKAAFKKNG